MRYFAHRYHFQMTTNGSGIGIVARERMTIRDKVKRFMEYRRRKRDEDLSVDTFFNRGSNRPRFANFDDN